MTIIRQIGDDDDCEIHVDRLQRPPEVGCAECYKGCQWVRNHYHVKLNPRDIESWYEVCSLKCLMIVLAKYRNGITLECDL